jgi:hypothetical protein
MHTEEENTRKMRRERVIHSNYRDEVELMEKGIFEPNFKG